MTTLANWFREKLGIASAIALSGYMCGGLIAPFVVRLVDGQGWRSAIDIFAIGMLILVIPLSLLFRHRPEPYGYLPDGRISHDITSSIPEKSVSGIKSTTLKQILKKRAFWHISLAFTLLHMAPSAFAIHVLPYLSSIGIERTTASLYVALLSVPAVAGRLMFGWIIDRYSKRMVTQALFITMGLAMFCFGYAATADAGFLFVGLILFGASFGGAVPVRASITRELFGGKSFGSIFGMIVGLNLLGLMSGPPLAGWVFDTWYSYNTSWLILAGSSVFGMILIFTIPRSGVLEPIEEAV
jgi:sugar phosphate permease